jgi:hypothetical protein
LDVFKALSAKDQDDLTSHLIMQRAQKGDVAAALYLRDHPRLRVMVFYVRGYRLDQQEELENGGRLQCVQMDFSIGLRRMDDTDWEDDFLYFDVQIDAEADNNVKWKNWGQLYSQSPHDKLLPIFLGDWIKKPRQLKSQRPGCDKYLIENDTEMSLPRFVARLKTWKHWANGKVSQSETKPTTQAQQ